ncbi:MAG: CTP synthase [bacterium]|nr:CTP synthase [bacterium]
MATKPTKYIFVTGGVLSGVGKGITAASIGNILKARGLTVNIQKCDPYLNVDAGTLNPAEHGECFVTMDGAETDLDLGHYERFLDIELTQSSSTMSGRILRQVIDDERAGKYLGKTVQFVPHVTKAMQSAIEAAGRGFDVHIVEVGGTVGDIEGQAFIESIRELAQKRGRENCLFVHVVYIPYLGASGEYKSKPAQNAVKDLRSVGIVPDILVARSEAMPGRGIVDKLSLFAGVDKEAIALLPNAKSIYEVPLSLENQGIGTVIESKLGFSTITPSLEEWKKMVATAVDSALPKVRVGIVAKYMHNQDTYMSVFEALKAAAWANKKQVEIVWIDAENLESKRTNLSEILKGLDGIVVPGGFGQRALEGKIKAATYALDNNLPYLGLCLGLQMAVIAAARRAGLAKASSTELNRRTPDPVIHTMEHQKGKEGTGGTMRLGNYDCKLTKGSLAEKCYKSNKIIERHRHRYEANNSYVGSYESWGIRATGINPKTGLVEIIEGINHPFFLASQFHPELKSRPNAPHPMFLAYINALIKD